MSNITGSFYTSNSNLENLIPAQADITDITQRITGITYDGITDTTIIDNNLTVTAPHVLTLNGINVYETINNNTNAISGLDTRVTTLETNTTGISYVSGTDTTTISNNVIIPTGKTLTLNGGDVDAQITALEDKTTGIFYNFTFNETLVDHDLIVAIGSELYVNGQDVNSRFNTLEFNTTGITYDTLSTTTISNSNIILNGLIDASGNNITDIGNIYINAGGAVYIGGSPINTSSLLTLNNTWTGTNNFTANEHRVATQVANTSSTLSASTDFVMNQFDWFTSNSQIYTGASATQNFTNTNITVPTQSNADNSQKASNSVYVNNKFTQFRTDNQTINGVITFAVPPVSTQSLSLLENTTRMPNATWIYSNMGGQTSIGIYTEFADFYNFGSPLTTIYLNDATFTMDGRRYVVNAKPLGIHPNSYVQNGGTVAGHQGVIQLLARGNTTGNNWVSLNWNTPGTYSIHPFNMAMFECCLCNVSSNTLNTNFIIWAGMSGDSTPNNFFGWKYDSGSWRAVYVESGVETFVGIPYPGFVNPLIGRYMRLNVIFRVSGNTMTLIWNYLNTWTGESASYAQAGINNSSLPMMGPFTYVFTPTYTSNIDVNINLDTWITKYYCNRG